MVRAALLSLLIGGGSAAFDNMNGAYLYTPTPGAPNGTFNTKWDEYPNGGVEYFEVSMGPMTTLYAEVWWKNVPAVPLPAELIERFNGKGMAVVGYETDAVRKTDKGDVSVPINMAYNHHHDVFISGRHSEMRKVPYDPEDLTVPLMARAAPDHRMLPVETSPSTLGLPTSLHLADGNGGEYRKSYHGFPPPVAYVIDSPQSAHVNPMFIDTWNRDKMSIDGGSPFVAGPEPKTSLAPEGAVYSGLLECPMTTRIRKVFPDGNTGYGPTYPPTALSCAVPSDGAPTNCAHVVGTAEDCFTAARVAVGNGTALNTSTGSSDTLPTGCTLQYNGAGGVHGVFYNQKQTTVCCGAGVTAVAGSVASVAELDLTIEEDTITLSLTGPEGVWFGVGFFAQAMEDAPYAIIVDGYGNVTERVLASHMGTAPSPGGKLISPSVTVVSSVVSGGNRTVHITRQSRGATAEHASFAPQNLTIPFINAVGSTPTFRYHKRKTAASLSLWPTASSPVCLCEIPAAPFGKGKGILRYVPTQEEFGFINACRPEPSESVLANKNPTCDVRAYAGGLQVCKHGWTLLDADQGQPWADQPLVYYQKYRFYFQEYKPSLHVIARPRAVWAIGAFIGEYDVPQCPPGTPTEKCIHEIWGVVTPAYEGGNPLHIAAAHFHCHAPTCLAMELWNNKTGELICRQRPVYGGAGASEPKFDEAGYILQPPCLWGDAPGLAPMPRASGVEFTVRAITNSTYGHSGEMAFPEFALVPWNTTSNRPQPGNSYGAGETPQWRLLAHGGLNAGG